MRRLIAPILSVPLLAKLAGANILIVLAALVGVAIERRVSFSSNVVPILGIALAASLVVNLVLVYVALRPLSDLEHTATQLAAGDMEARVPDSILADRDMARVGTMLNDLLDRLTEDRARERRLAAQVISAQDEERARVARELHDSTAQILTAVMLQLGAAAHESTSPALDARIATLRELASEALEEVRSLSHTMHPRVLDDLGLGPALEWLARQTQAQEPLDVQVVATEFDPPIPAPPGSAVSCCTGGAAQRSATCPGESRGRQPAARRPVGGAGDRGRWARLRRRARGSTTAGHGTILHARTCGSREWTVDGE